MSLKDEERRHYIEDQNRLTMLGSLIIFTGLLALLVGAGIMIYKLFLN